MGTVADKLKVEKYSEYKDSGVQWLREIPKHWGIYKGKWLFIKQERPARKEDGIITCFRDGEVTLRANRKTEGFTIALKEHGYQGIRKGDLVIHNMDAFAGAIGISDSDGKSTPVYSACTPRIPHKVNPYYYAYFLKDLAKSGFIESLAKGIRERSTDFRFNDFGLLLLSVPPLHEQTAIAAFLDRKTALIDQAIDIKQKQIELLKERRQILIHKAVTRGLNPNVKMKDSGVEWIGEIPEGWEVRRFKFLCNITTGSKNTEDKIENGLYPFYVRSQTPERINSYTFEGEAILTAGDGAGVGKVFHYLNEKFDFHQRVYKFSNFRNIKGKLLFYFLQNNFHNVALNGEAKSTVDSLRLPLIQNFQVALPSDLEQRQIIEHIENVTTKVAKAISLKEQEIEKLKEYKATLINSAVTGKIKVC
jgi:type I restriction enzyme S subunit